MNVSNGNVSLRIGLERVATFYFYEHFYRAFKEQKFDKFTCQFEHEEVCCSCSDCSDKKTKQCLINTSNLPEKLSFHEIRKRLI